MAITLQKLNQIEALLPAKFPNMSKQEKDAVSQMIMQKRAQLLASSNINPSDVPTDPLQRGIFEQQVGAGTFQPKETSKQQENVEKIESVGETIDFLGKKLEEVESRGPYAKLNPFISSLTGGAINPKTMAYDALRKASIGPVARAISSEVGVLTDRDIARAESLLPQVGDTKEAADLKIKNIKELVELKTKEKRIVTSSKTSKSRFKIEAIE